MRIQSPVLPCRVRNDGWGFGDFGKPRGTSPGGALKYHDGVDLIVEPGQLITSPFNGTVEKIDYPYATALEWKGIQIANEILRCEIWYMEPKDGLVGNGVGIGWPIGYAQNISKKYPPNPRNGVMTPHVHVRISFKPFTCLIRNTYLGSDIFVDPMVFFEQSLSQ